MSNATNETLTFLEIEQPFERAAIVGDVHGCADTLEALLEQIPDERPIFFVGDLVNRGRDSRRVVQTMIDRGARGVCGNHELWLRAWLRGESLSEQVLRPRFGVGETLLSYGLEPTLETLAAPVGEEIPRAHREFLLALPHVLGITVADQAWWIIHAGIPIPDAVESTPTPSSIEGWIQTCGTGLLWNRSPLEGRPIADRAVLMGHHPQREVTDLGHLIALDTGAGLWSDGHLSALLLPERESISLPVDASLAAAAE